MKTQQKKAEKGQPASALNIRNFPKDLLWACRSKAAAQEQLLREFVIDTLRQAAAPNHG